MEKKKMNKGLKITIIVISVVLGLLFLLLIGFVLLTHPYLIIKPKNTCGYLDGGTMVYDYGSYTLIEYRVGMINKKKGYKIILNGNTIYDAHPELNYSGECPNY